MLDWSDLRILRGVAEHGSLAGAGRSLGLNHATIGRRLDALERALGARLVDRLPRGVVLTPLGREVAAIAGQMGDLADTAVRRSRGESAGVSGTVTISAPPVFASGVLAAWLAPLLAANPALSVVLDATLDVVSLNRGDADIAIRLVRPDQPSLVARRVGVVRLGLYAAPQVASGAAEDWCFITYDAILAHVPHYRWFEQYIGTRTVALRTSDAHAMKAAVRAGVGVAMLPCFDADDDPGLIRVDPAAAPADRDIWMVVHPDLRRSATVRAVLDHLIARFAVDPRLH